jgi:hypothetical protein
MSTTENIHAGAEDRATQRVSWWVAGNYENGEATCRRWEAMTETAWQEVVESREETGDPLDEVMASQAYELAKQLKDWLTEEELSEEAQTGLVGDLVGYMVACVDFEQLARDALEQREIESR